LGTKHRYEKFEGSRSGAYFASAQTSEIVNLAIRLGRPLLIEGEPGCGKTRLAGAVAEELGLSDRLISMTVKSTSQAKDLLYRFDALRRLQDAQSPTNEKACAVYPYITLEPLGCAIRAGKPCVVLIDEIDKADIDFPNDLLDVLDRFEFEVSDLPSNESEICLAKNGFGRLVRPPPGSAPPVVLITSNREKQLPEPFLRRCLYLQLDFPTDVDDLLEIVRRNLHDELVAIGDDLVAGAVQRFLEIRERGQDLNMQKPPATSELLDWIRVLHWQGRSVERIATDHLTAIDQSILFKIRQDVQRYRARTADEAGS
jgi:MoxR-like ATPase